MDKNHKIDILVVDDSVVQAEYLKHILEKHNYVVKTVYSGNEAMEYLQHNVPSLVITDVIMPKMSGFDLCKNIKENIRTSKIPVILVTALSEPEDIIKGLASGADNFITKPFSPEFLLSRVYYTIINTEIRKNMAADIGIDIVFGGKKYMINSNKTQILDLLLSTYESAVEKNRELESTIVKLKNTQKELIEAKESAELANKYKSEFLANISHEIRTPMNAILGIVEIMIDSSNNEENLNSLRLLKHSAESLLYLLNDILDISKVESGKMTIINTTFEIRALIRTIETLFKVSAEKKLLDFKLSVSPDVPEFIFADPMRVKQILINMISNAIKFTEKGYVEVNVLIDEKPDNKEKVILFSVTDTGIGISKDKQELIFEPFLQLDSSTTKRFGGTGLGLSICKGLIELMGGTIHLESELNKGSKFSFSIPLLPLPEDNQKEYSFQNDEFIKKQESSVNNMKVLNILVVDDNDINHLIANRMLTKKGHIVTSAYSGAEALDLIKENKFDLIFMDVNMPELDGLETTVRIREMEINNSVPSVPIVAMTAYAMKEDKEKCLKAGMNDYISKPINTKELDLIISKYL